MAVECGIGAVQVVDNETNDDDCVLVRHAYEIDLIVRCSAVGVPAVVDVVVVEDYVDAGGRPSCPFEHNVTGLYH